MKFTILLLAVVAVTGYSQTVQVRPSVLPGGSYTIQTPAGTAGHIRPNSFPGGGFSIEVPGTVPGHIRPSPFPGGGYVIEAPRPFIPILK